MGATLTLMSGFATAQSQGAAGQINKNLNYFNADIQDIQAEDALKRGHDEEMRYRTSIKQLVGKQRAGFAGQGVQLDDIGATTVDVTKDTFTIGEMDALTIRNNARLEAWGYRARGADYRLRGDFAELEAGQKQLGTALTVGSQLFRDIKKRS